MDRARKSAVYNQVLQIEACHFEAVTTPFPSHFHDYYVIGLVEEGQRRLSCGHSTYTVEKGSILLFNPGDSHACESCGGSLSYRSLHLSQALMLSLAEELTNRRELPCFPSPVVRDLEAACCLRAIHGKIMGGGAEELDREEGLLLLLSGLLQPDVQPLTPAVPEREVELVCAYIEEHFGEHISLDQLCRCANSSKSTLLRTFARWKGMTPYRYLETVRVNAARKLLEEGTPPAEAALRAGFSDQSHFTNQFGRMIGLTPGAYRDIHRAGGVQVRAAPIHKKRGKQDEFER